MADRPRRKPAPRMLTEEELERSLHSAARYRGTRVVEGRTDRAGALEQIRDTIGGFPAGRYEAELDAALAGIEVATVDVRARRARHVAEARAQIEEAVARSDALIEEGIRMGIGAWDTDADMAHLRAAHPGFSDRALGDALDRGHLIHR